MNSAAVVLINVRKRFGVFFFFFFPSKNGQVPGKYSCPVGCPFPRLLAGENCSLGLFLVCACWYFLAADLPSIQARASRSLDYNLGNSLLGCCSCPKVSRQYAAFSAASRTCWVTYSGSRPLPATTMKLSCSLQGIDFSSP